MQILSNPKLGLRPSFYIARVGSCAGKPLKTPYTSNNSMAVYSDDPETDFQRVMALYKGRVFYPYLLGSCQPAIRVRDVRKIIDERQLINEKQAKAASALELHIENLEAQIKKARELQVVLYRASLNK